MPKRSLVDMNERKGHRTHILLNDDIMEKSLPELISLLKYRAVGKF